MTAQPTRYYPSKIRFIEAFLDHFGPRLSKQQRIDFALGAHSDFLELFSRRGEHAQVIDVYRRMLEYSWQTLIFRNGKPTLRLLYACVQSLRKAVASTTAH
jgi:hypothetical protein